MSSNLTTAQAETFDIFAAEVKEYLDKNSTSVNGGTTRVMETEVFLALWKTVSRPSGLRRVMQTQTFFNETGRTKKCFQKRDQEGNPLFKDEEKTLPLFTDSCCVMYTNEAYREKRAEITGLKSIETAYMVPWNKLPGDLQYRIASNYFPRTVDNNKNPLPRFVPTSLGIVLRKGAKVKKGEKRHSWAGFDFLVAGIYGDDKIPTVITQIAVPDKPYLAKFAEFIGVACPDWGQNEEQPEQEVSEELSKAACGRVQWVTIMDNLL